MKYTKEGIILIPALLLALGGALFWLQQRPKPGQDPVFKPGQVWQLTFTRNDQPVTKDLTVGQRMGSNFGVFTYRTIEKTPQGEHLTLFWYDPVDDTPEFIFAKHRFTPADGGEPGVEWCLVRQPKVRLGQPMTGTFSTEARENVPFVVFKKYIESGDLSGFPACTLTKVKD